MLFVIIEIINPVCYDTKVFILNSIIKLISFHETCFDYAFIWLYAVTHQHSLDMLKAYVKPLIRKRQSTIRFAPTLQNCYDISLLCFKSVEYLVENTCHYLVTNRNFFLLPTKDHVNAFPDPALISNISTRVFKINLHQISYDAIG